MAKRSDETFAAALLQSAPEAIIGADRDFRICTWNEAAERLFGYTADEMIGQPTRVLLPPGREVEHSTALARALAGHDVPAFQTERRHKDGRLVNLSITGSAVRARDGTVLGVSAICRQIGRIPRVEQAARLLAAVVESSEDAIVTKDLDGMVMSWNRAAERIFGYPAAEMIGQSIRRLIPEERQSEEGEVLARVGRGERVAHFETLRRRRDGSLVPISLSVSPVQDAEGRVVGASKIARDITAQREAVAERERLLALAREEAETTRVLNEVGVVVAGALDRATIVRAVTGMATQAIGAETGAFVPVDAQPDSAVEDASPPSSRLTVPVRSRGREVLGHLVFGHGAAGAFTERHERLAVGIASWAAVALENARLYVEAQDANRLKDEFLATLSHELRTPLNAVIGYVKMIRSGLIEEDRHDAAMATIERNAASLVQIVEDLLDVSRVASGKIRLDVHPVDLAQVAAHAMEAVRPAAEARGVALSLTAAHRPAMVRGDADRLQQVLWNLVTNAVKFTPRGGSVAVSVGSHDGHVEALVRDTGIGIHPAFLPHVFERFRQADGGNVHGRGGLGLGLSIARHLVEMHGGTVEAASEGEHRGATFRVCLPAVR